MAPVPRQPDDRQGGDEAGDREHREVEPHRRAVVVAEVPGQVLEDPYLDLVDELEEAPRQERHEQTDDRREHQQTQIGLAPQGRVDVRGRRRRIGAHRTDARSDGAFLHHPEQVMAFA